MAKQSGTMTEVQKQRRVKKEPKAKEPKLLKNPIAYQGSKAAELHHIDKYKPEQFTKFVDIFGGGGVVALYFLQKYPQLEEVIYNDIDKSMCNLFTILKDEAKTAELLKWLNEQNYTEEEWMIRAEKYRKSAKDNIAERLYIKRLAFRGMENAVIVSKRNVGGELKLCVRKDYNDFTKYPPILSDDKFKVSCETALKVIDAYKDDENAFLYLDPPYITTNNETYAECDGKTIHKLLDIIKDETIKCKIMIHIEFLGYTYDKLKEHMKVYYPKRYELSGMTSGKELYQKYIMIATNY